MARRANHFQDAAAGCFLWKCFCSCAVNGPGMLKNDSLEKGAFSSRSGSFDVLAPPLANNPLCLAVLQLDAV